MSRLIKQTMKTITLILTENAIHDLARQFSQNTGIEALVVSTSALTDSSALKSASAILMTPECAKDLCCRKEPTSKPIFAISEVRFVIFTAIRNNNFILQNQFK